MWEIVQAGGLLMAPIILCSLLSVAIFAERLWTLRREKIVPANLVEQVRGSHQGKALDATQLTQLRQHSPLGRVLAAGLANEHLDRTAVKEGIEDAGRHVVHELERYLNTLGTIAAITPLLGLLGTVIGMIKVFFAITTVGVGDPTALAEGISEALITTAAGLSVAIPSLIFYRYLRGRVAEIVVDMEGQAIQLMEALYAEGVRPRRRTTRAKAATS
ncbi:MAG: MotA/TolQ/ExbB proton channel family protein [Pseudomonadota bacterium]|nr:MotA/TolQ/ExbB proton channel family protein [Pseudomonadota bacterium]